MTLSDAANISTIAQFVFWLILTFGGGFLIVGYIRKMRPVWKRFTDNVGRNIAVISTEAQSMDHEADLLDRVGYFKIKKLSADERNLNLIRGFVLLVIGYSPDSNIYKATLAYAKTNDLPIIVFSGKHRLSNEDRDELKNYSFSSLCETELRLVSDVFAIMSTFPEVKKDAR